MSKLCYKVENKINYNKKNDKIDYCNNSSFIPRVSFNIKIYHNDSKLEWKDRKDEYHAQAKKIQ